MTDVVCIRKFYNNNYAYMYKLCDCNGVTQDIEAKQLKQLMQSGQLRVLNLKLSSNNRIINDNSYYETITPKTKFNRTKLIEAEQILKKFIVKSKALGVKINTIITSCKHECYVISRLDNNNAIDNIIETLGEEYTDTILYIPDNVEVLTKTLNEGFTMQFLDIIDKYEHELKPRLLNYPHSIKVIGGQGLKDSRLMFYNLSANTALDISMLDTHNVVNMDRMFSGCKTHKLDLTYMDTSNVVSMRNMFAGCNAKCIDLSKFNFNKVMDMTYMFRMCLTDHINMGESRILYANVYKMFERCDTLVTSSDIKILNAYRSK